MAMGEWTWAYLDHQIRVVTASNGSARLYVDGELLDVTNDIYASEQAPTLAGVFGELLVEAFAGFVQPSVRVNGQWVGNQACAAASD
jgi:hypothetical protein